jgi:hypothetical protein
MARKNSLNCLEKRDLLNQQASSLETLKSWGERFEEVEAVYDAVDFYEKAGATDALHRLLDKAREDGNVFLVTRLCRALRIELEPEGWLHIGKKAEEAGMMSFAAQAYRSAGITETDDKETSR